MPLSPDLSPASKAGRGCSVNDVDTRGLLCPLPVARTHAGLAKLDPGARLDVLADDPLARIDLRVYCAKEGHDYLGDRETGGKTWRISIRKGDRSRRPNDPAARDGGTDVAFENLDPASIDLGIPSIDAEHREQLDRMNRLSASIAEGGAPERIADDLSDLIDYLDAHFRSEEIAMREHAYPETADHRREHDDAITILRDLQRRFMAGDVTVSDELLRGLRSWLIAHIGSFDRRLADFMLAKGADPP